MTTVKQLREFLAKLPDDAVVRVLKEKTRGYETFTTWENLVLPADTTDCTENVCLWGAKINNNCHLDLGEN